MLKSFFIILILYFLIISTQKAEAVDMTSPRYRIQYGNVNIGARDMSSDSAKLSTTLGQLAALQFNSTGYILKAGFQYFHSIIPFTFSISKIKIDFGTLQASHPVTDTADLTVSFGGAGQYQVTAQEIGPLKTLSSSVIDDTICNGGVNTCSESSAKVWDSDSAYGFGYNMSNNDIPSDFLGSTYYRPFADSSVPESPVTIMSNTNVGKNRQATITFKVNIGPVQPAGSYQTVIKFVATPSF